MSNKLPQGWEEKELSDFINFNPKESIKKGTVAKSIPMACLKEFCKNITEYEEKEFKGGTKFRNGDTLLARITPCLENGKTAFIDFLEEDEIAFGSTEYIVLREKEKVSNKDFIYYLSISPRFREIAIKSMTGSSGRQRVQNDVLFSKKFILPSDINEQKRIADILSAFDDKIEINNQINKTLEEMASALFKEWFINKAETNWIQTKIKNFDVIVTDYVANGSFKSLAENVNYNNNEGYSILIRLTDYNNNFNGKFVYIDKHGHEFLKKSELFGGEVVISNVGAYSGTVFKVPYLKRPMSLGPNAIVLKSNFNNFFYLFFKSFYGQHLLDGIITGSAQPKFNKTAFRNLDITYPSIEYIKDFEQIVEPYFKKIEQNQQENKILKQQRDALLPKLISGEIRV